ncbi:hypothetical protein C8Q76DRAFT_801248 [Earliella scabrosa]|nr:hypothetical protein C8Q76DRAFT_801248 [Earliella scabrosa]
MPALRDTPMILFNDVGITCKVLLCDGKEVLDKGTDVHLSIVECGPGLHALLVCGLLGGRMPNPPVVLFKTMLPDKLVSLEFIQMHSSVVVSQGDLRYALEFRHATAFWEAVLSIATAELSCHWHEQHVEALLESALREVPTISDHKQSEPSVV